MRNTSLDEKNKLHFCLDFSAAQVSLTASITVYKDCMLNFFFFFYSTSVT